MAGRRGKGEGTIRQRPDGRWEARMALADGKRKSLYGETRQEVARALTKVLRDRDQGLLVLGERQTIGQYLASWMEAKQHRIKRSSAARYERQVRLHLIPGLGRIVLSKLTAQHVSTFYAKQLADGMSPKNIAYCHMVLHAAIRDALRLDLVHRNVVELVEPARARKKEMAVYSEEQVRTFLRSLSGDRFEALAVTALATGMRVGELLALRWQDIDFDRAAILVHATVQHYKGEEPTIEEAKTDHSRRRIGLSKTALAALVRHRERQDEERARLKDAWCDLGLVFPNRIGLLYDPKSFQRRWLYPRLKKANLPRIRFHDLRHTAATLLLARGVNIKVVSEMLGHATVAMTLTIYGHVLPHMQQQAAHTMDDIMKL